MCCHYHVTYQHWLRHFTDIHKSSVASWDSKVHHMHTSESLRRSRTSCTFRLLFYEYCEFRKILNIVLSLHTTYRYYLVGKYAISNAVSAEGCTCLDIDLDIGHTCLDVYTSPSCSLIVLMTVEIHHLVINDSIFYRTSEINRNMSDLLY